MARGAEGDGSVCNVMALWAVRAVFLAVLLLGTTAAAAEPGDFAIGRADWTAANYKVLSGALADVEATNGFIHAAMRSAELGAKPMEETGGDDGVPMGSRFFDMLGNGRLELLFALDNSGRGLTGLMMALSRVGSRYAVAALDVGPWPGVPEPARCVRDLKHNGRFEVVLDRLLQMPKSRATPTPWFEDVYIYDGSAFKLASGEFREYYANEVLPDLRRRLDNADSPDTISALRASIAYTTQFLAGIHGAVK